MAYTYSLSIIISNGPFNVSEFDCLQYYLKLKPFPNFHVPKTIGPHKILLHVRFSV